MFKKVKDKMENFTRDLKSIFFNKRLTWNLETNTITENKNSVGGFSICMLHCQHVTC